MLASLSQSVASYAGRNVADQSVLNSTALVNATNLAVAIGVSEVWEIVWWLSFTFSATGLLKVAVTTPASAVQSIRASLISGLLTASGTTPTSGTAIVLSPATATSGVVTVTTTVANSTTAGSVNLQFAQNALDGAVATVCLANSSVFARKI